jgi:glycine cleavage system aminomethyltransferase T
VACNRSCHEHQSAAVGRVLRVQASSFLGKTRHDSPKKRVRSKKFFSFQLKKRGARVACNRSGHEHQSAAVGRVLRVQASSF